VLSDTKKSTKVIEAAIAPTNIPIKKLNIFSSGTKNMAPNGGVDPHSLRYPRFSRPVSGPPDIIRQK
jgi:hypothetical protein